MAETIPIRPTRDQRPTRPGAVPPPPAPEHLSARCQDIWPEIVTDWVIGPEALPILRAGLEQLDQYDQARAQLAREGLTIVHPKTGNMRAHPAVKIAQDALSSFRQCFRQLGLQPPEHL